MIWFGSIDSTTISWNTVIYVFCYICASYFQQVYSCPLVLSLFCLHGSMGFRAPWLPGPWLKCHENEEKIENDFVLRHDHGIKTTQPISIILVSFFSCRRQCFIWWKKKKSYTFEYQSNENRAFRFWRDTRCNSIKHKNNIQGIIR